MEPVRLGGANRVFREMRDELVDVFAYRGVETALSGIVGSCWKNLHIDIAKSGIASPKENRNRGRKPERTTLSAPGREQTKQSPGRTRCGKVSQKLSANEQAKDIPVSRWLEVEQPLISDVACPPEYVPLRFAEQFCISIIPRFWQYLTRVLTELNKVWEPVAASERGCPTCFSLIGCNCVNRGDLKGNPLRNFGHTRISKTDVHKTRISKTDVHDANCLDEREHRALKFCDALLGSLLQLSDALVKIVNLSSRTSAPNCHLRELQLVCLKAFKDSASQHGSILAHVCLQIVAGLPLHSADGGDGPPTQVIRRLFELARAGNLVGCNLWFGFLSHSWRCSKTNLCSGPESGGEDVFVGDWVKYGIVTQHAFSTAVNNLLQGKIVELRQYDVSSQERPNFPNFIENCPESFENGQAASLLETPNVIRSLKQLTALVTSTSDKDLARRVRFQVEELENSESVESQDQPASSKGKKTKKQDSNRSHDKHVAYTPNEGETSSYQDEADEKMKGASSNSQMSSQIKTSQKLQTIGLLFDLLGCEGLWTEAVYGVVEGLTVETVSAIFSLSDSPAYCQFLHAKRTEYHDGGDFLFGWDVTDILRVCSCRLIPILLETTPIFARLAHSECAASGPMATGGNEVFAKRQIPENSPKTNSRKGPPSRQYFDGVREENSGEVSIELNLSQDVRKVGMDYIDLLLTRLLSNILSQYVVCGTSHILAAIRSISSYSDSVASVAPLSASFVSFRDSSSQSCFLTDLRRALQILRLVEKTQRYDRLRHDDGNCILSSILLAPVPPSVITIEDGHTLKLQSGDSQLARDAEVHVIPHRRDSLHLSKLLIASINAQLDRHVSTFAAKESEKKCRDSKGSVAYDALFAIGCSNETVVYYGSESACRIEPNLGRTDIRPGDTESYSEGSEEMGPKSSGHSLKKKPDYSGWAQKGDGSSSRQRTEIVKRIRKVDMHFPQTLLCLTLKTYDCNKTIAACSYLVEFARPVLMARESSYSHALCSFAFRRRKSRRRNPSKTDNTSLSSIRELDNNPTSRLTKTFSNLPPMEGVPSKLSNSSSGLPEVANRDYQSFSIFPAMKKTTGRSLSHAEKVPSGVTSLLQRHHSIGPAAVEDSPLPSNNERNIGCRPRRERNLLTDSKVVAGSAKDASSVYIGFPQSTRSATPMKQVHKKHRKHNLPIMNISPLLIASPLPPVSNRHDLYNDSQFESPDSGCRSTSSLLTDKPPHKHPSTTSKLLTTYLPPLPDNSKSSSSRNKRHRSRSTTQLMKRKNNPFRSTDGERPFKKHTPDGYYEDEGTTVEKISNQSGDFLCSSHHPTLNAYRRTVRSITREFSESCSGLSLLRGQMCSGLHCYRPADEWLSRQIGDTLAINHKQKLRQTDSEHIQYPYFSACLVRGFNPAMEQKVAVLTADLLLASYLIETAVQVLWFLRFLEIDSNAALPMFVNIFNKLSSDALFPVALVLHMHALLCEEIKMKAESSQTNRTRKTDCRCLWCRIDEGDIFSLGIHCDETGQNGAEDAILSQQFSKHMIISRPRDSNSCYMSAISLIPDSQIGPQDKLCNWKRTSAPNQEANEDAMSALTSAANFNFSAISNLLEETSNPSMGFSTLSRMWENRSNVALDARLKPQTALPSNKQIWLDLLDLQSPSSGPILSSGNGLPSTNSVAIKPGSESILPIHTRSRVTYASSFSAITANLNTDISKWDSVAVQTNVDQLDFAKMWQSSPMGELIGMFMSLCIGGCSQFVYLYEGLLCRFYLSPLFSISIDCAVLEMRRANNLHSRSTLSDEERPANDDEPLLHRPLSTGLNTHENPKSLNEHFADLDCEFEEGYYWLSDDDMSVLDGDECEGEVSCIDSYSFSSKMTPIQSDESEPFNFTHDPTLHPRLGEKFSKPINHIAEIYKQVSCSIIKRDFQVAQYLIEREKHSRNKCNNRLGSGFEVFRPETFDLGGIPVASKNRSEQLRDVENKKNSTSSHDPAGPTKRVGTRDMQETLISDLCISAEVSLATRVSLRSFRLDEIVSPRGKCETSDRVSEKCEPDTFSRPCEEIGESDLKSLIRYMKKGMGKTHTAISLSSCGKLSTPLVDQVEIVQIAARTILRVRTLTGKQYILVPRNSRGEYLGKTSNFPKHRHKADRPHFTGEPRHQKFGARVFDDKNLTDLPRPCSEPLGSKCAEQQNPNSKARNLMQRLKVPPFIYFSTTIATSGIWPDCLLPHVNNEEETSHVRETSRATYTRSPHISMASPLAPLSHDIVPRIDHEVAKQSKRKSSPPRTSKYTHWKMCKTPNSDGAAEETSLYDALKAVVTEHWPAEIQHIISAHKSSYERRCAGRTVDLIYAFSTVTLECLDVSSHICQSVSGQSLPICELENPGRKKEAVKSGHHSKTANSDAQAALAKTSAHRLNDIVSDFVTYKEVVSKEALITLPLLEAVVLLICDQLYTDNCGRTERQKSALETSCLSGEREAKSEATTLKYEANTFYQVEQGDNLNLYGSSVGDAWHKHGSTFKEKSESKYVAGRGQEEPIHDYCFSLNKIGEKFGSTNQKLLTSIIDRLLQRGLLVQVTVSARNKERTDSLTNPLSCEVQRDIQLYTTPKALRHLEHTHNINNPAMVTIYPYGKSDNPHCRQDSIRTESPLISSPIRTPVKHTSLRDKNNSLYNEEEEEEFVKLDFMKKGTPITNLQPITTPLLCATPLAPHNNNAPSHPLDINGEKGSSCIVRKSSSGMANGGLKNGKFTRDANSRETDEIYGFSKKYISSDIFSPYMSEYIRGRHSAPTPILRSPLASPLLAPYQGNQMGTNANEWKEPNRSSTTQQHKSGRNLQGLNLPAVVAELALGEEYKLKKSHRSRLLQTNRNIKEMYMNSTPISINDSSSAFIKDRINQSKLVPHRMSALSCLQNWTQDLPGLDECSQDERHLRRGLQTQAEPRSTKKHSRLNSGTPVKSSSRLLKKDKKHTPLRSSRGVKKSYGSLSGEACRSVLGPNHSGPSDSSVHPAIISFGFSDEANRNGTRGCIEEDICLAAQMATKRGARTPNHHRSTDIGSHSVGSLDVYSGEETHPSVAEKLYTEGYQKIAAQNTERNETHITQLDLSSNHSFSKNLEHPSQQSALDPRQLRSLKRHTKKNAQADNQAAARDLSNSEFLAQHFKNFPGEQFPRKADNSQPPNFEEARVGEGDKLYQVSPDGPDPGAHVNLLSDYEEIEQCPSAHVLQRRDAVSPYNVSGSFGSRTNSSRLRNDCQFDSVSQIYQDGNNSAPIDRHSRDVLISAVADNSRNIGSENAENDCAENAKKKGGHNAGELSLMHDLNSSDRSEEWSFYDVLEFNEDFLSGDDPTAKKIGSHAEYDGRSCRANHGGDTKLKGEAEPPLEGSMAKRRDRMTKTKRDASLNNNSSIAQRTRSKEASDCPRKKTNEKRTANSNKEEIPTLYYIQDDCSNIRTRLRSQNDSHCSASPKNNKSARQSPISKKLHIPKSQMPQGSPRNRKLELAEGATLQTGGIKQESNSLSKSLSDRSLRSTRKQDTKRNGGAARAEPKTQVNPDRKPYSTKKNPIVSKGKSTHKSFPNNNEDEGGRPDIESIVMSESSNEILSKKKHNATFEDEQSELLVSMQPEGDDWAEYSNHDDENHYHSSFDYESSINNDNLSRANYYQSNGCDPRVSDNENEKNCEKEDLETNSADLELDESLSDHHLAEGVLGGFHFGENDDPLYSEYHVSDQNDEESQNSDSCSNSENEQVSENSSCQDQSMDAHEDHTIEDQERDSKVNDEIMRIVQHRKDTSQQAVKSTPLALIVNKLNVFEKQNALIHDNIRTWKDAEVILLLNDLASSGKIKNSCGNWEIP